ncbi:MAG: gp58-like family protein [Liquorilactobacillus satsumensis]|uniref:gp58-like family protein n=1 Tax=Liquorilactobacillus satsumensis TaxID=259059 RepID=UPI0039EBDD85
MITQSDKTLEAWRATERVLDAIVTINGTDYHTTDITSIAYDSGAFTGDTFAIGSTYENGLTIEFSHIVEGLEQGQKVTAKVGIKTSDGTYEYCPLGVFIVSDDIQMDRNNDQTSIKCYDQMCLMEGTYTSKLSYPASAADIIAEIANMVGVTLNTDEIARLPAVTSLANAISGQTYRDAIGWIAQFYAGFATFDRDGKLTIRTIATPDYTLNPSQYEQAGLTKNEAPYKIGGIQCEVTTTTTDSTGESTDNTVTLQAGDSTGSQIKLTNNLMTQERLEMVWAQLKDINFYPYSLNWFGNPAIEAGDWLTLQDTKGNKFNVPNNSYTMAFDGSFSAVSKADQTSTSSSTYAWNGQLTQVVKTLVGKLTPAGNFIYGPEKTDEPTGAKFNDLWYKQNGNKLEMWTFERQSDGSGKWSLTVSDSTGVEVKASVDAAHQEAQTAITNANTAITQADTAIQQAGFANTVATESQTIANDAKTSAGTAMSNAQTALQRAQQALAAGNTNSTDITNVSKDLSDAKTGLQNQITDNKNNINDTTANLATVSKDLNTTKSNLQTVSDQATQNGKNINTTNNTVNGIKTDLANTKGDVTELQTTASGLSADMVNAKGDISSLKTKAGSLESSMSTVTGDISTLKQTTNSLSSQMSGKVDTTVYQSDKTQTANSISNVVTKLDSIQIGGVNLWLGTKDFNSQYWYSKDATLVTDSAVPDFSIVKSTTDWGSFKNRQPITFEKNVPYTVSVYAKGASSGNMTITLYTSYESGYAVEYDISTTLTEEYQRYSVTFIGDGLTYNNTRIEPHGTWSNVGNSVYFYAQKLEKGNVATDYSVADADKANQTDFSATQQTVNELTTTVGSHTGDISTLKQTATTMQSDIKDNKDNISSVKQTASSLTSQMQNKVDTTVYQSDKTQTANSISNVVTKLDSIQIGGVNLWLGTKDFNSQYWYSKDATLVTDSAVPDFSIVKSTTDWGSFKNRQPITFEKNVPYTVSVYAKGASSGNMTITLYTSYESGYAVEYDISTTLTEEYQRYSVTFIGDGLTYNNTRIEPHGTWSNVGNSVYFYAQKLEKGNIATDYSIADADLATVTALSSVSQKADSISTTVTNNKSDADSKFSTINQTISGIQSTVSNKADNSTVTQLSNVVQTKVSSQDYTSKVTQLSDDINLRVEKSGVIAAIDVSSEGIQIYGDKLHITASTYIDNAVIKSAMIDTLSADKITVGTLNGANVNVINLNAANITTGTLSGSNLSLNLDTGEVLFQKGTIKSTDGLLDIEINDGTFSQNNSSGDGFIFRNGNIYFSNKSSWAAWDAPLYGTISLNERAFAAGQGGMAIKGAKNVVVQTDDYNGDFVMGPPSNLTGSGLLLREDRIEMASAQTYLYGGLGYSYINHPFIEIGTSIWENQYNDNAGSNVLIRASGIILDGDVMSLNGFHIANNYITTAGDGLWVNSAFGSGGNATIHAQSFSQTSLLSKKTNVIPLDRLKARNAIRTVDIQEYMYKDDVANGVTKKYSSGIIDDINEKPKYSMPFDWISADGKGREDGTALGYTIVAVQDLYDQIEDLKEQVKQLKGESAA